MTVAPPSHGMARFATRRKREGLASSEMRIGGVLSTLLTSHFVAVEQCNGPFVTAFLRRSHSMSSRKAAAAAKGPTTRLAKVSVHKTVNGVPNGTGPATAAFAAATPKIRTGTVKGRTMMAR